nr:MAG TPA: hypothetical protein [Caudoviricetes sp.]
MDCSCFCVVFCVVVLNLSTTKLLIRCYAMRTWWVREFKYVRMGEK